MGQLGVQPHSQLTGGGGRSGHGSQQHQPHKNGSTKQSISQNGTLLFPPTSSYSTNPRSNTSPGETSGRRSGHYNSSDAVPFGGGEANFVSELSLTTELSQVMSTPPFPLVALKNLVNIQRPQPSAAHDRDSLSSPISPRSESPASSSTNPSFVMRSPRVPVVVVSVACGAFHSLCLSSDGLVYSWGRAANGKTFYTTTYIYDVYCTMYPS